LGFLNQVSPLFDFSKFFVLVSGLLERFEDLLCLVLVKLEQLFLVEVEQREEGLLIDSGFLEVREQHGEHFKVGFEAEVALEVD